MRGGAGRRRGRLRARLAVPLEDRRQVLLDPLHGLCLAQISVAERLRLHAGHGSGRGGGRGGRGGHGGGHAHSADLGDPLSLPGQHVRRPLRQLLRVGLHRAQWRVKTHGRDRLRTADRAQTWSMVTGQPAVGEKHAQAPNRAARQAGHGAPARRRPRNGQLSGGCYARTWRPSVQWRRCNYPRLTPNKAAKDPSVL